MTTPDSEAITEGELDVARPPMMVLVNGVPSWKDPAKVWNALFGLFEECGNDMKMSLAWSPYLNTSNPISAADYWAETYGVQREVAGVSSAESIFALFAQRAQVEGRVPVVLCCLSPDGDHPAIVGPLRVLTDQHNIRLEVVLDGDAPTGRPA